MIRSNPEHFNAPTLPYQWTAEDQAIYNDLGHVAFMAWLIECRDKRDALIVSAFAKSGRTHAIVRALANS